MSTLHITIWISLLPNAIHGDLDIYKSQIQFKHYPCPDLRRACTETVVVTIWGEHTDSNLRTGQASTDARSPGAPPAYKACQKLACNISPEMVSWTVAFSLFRLMDCREENVSYKYLVLQPFNIHHCLERYCADASSKRIFCLKSTA